MSPEPTVMMKCGHAANSSTRVNNQSVPCCVICGVIEQANEQPNLEGRQAKCSQHKSGIPQPVPSKTNLAFFEYLPDREFDSFYCGCWGWD